LRWVIGWGLEAHLLTVPLGASPGQGFPSLNIRLFEQKPVSPDQVVSWGSMSPEMMGLLQDAIGQYLRVLIIGGTGTGKTTILSALTSYIPTDDRIVKIEDPEEIFIEHPHVVALEARPAPPGSEVPPYTIIDGVNDAMRMTPDWLVVGEVRTGDAAMSLFRAQMSDHPGLSLPLALPATLAKGGGPVPGGQVRRTGPAKAYTPATYGVCRHGLVFLSPSAGRGAGRRLARQGGRAARALRHALCARRDGRVRRWPVR
jgi:hypothetical protein